MKNIIKIKRILSGIKTNELAKMVGVSAAYISMIESGKRNPSEEIKKLLAQALDIPEELLFEEKEK